MTALDALYDARAKLISDADAILKRSQSDGAKWTAEDESQFDALHAEADKILGQINEKKTAQARVDRQTAAQDSLRETRGRRAPAGEPGSGRSAVESITFRGHSLRLPSSARARATAEYAEAFSAYMAFGEAAGVHAALQTDIEQSGGYLAPPQYVAELVKELDNTFWFRQLARVLPPTVAPKITLPRRTARSQAFQWGTELATPSADGSYKLGTYELAPHYMTGEMEVSKDLLAAGSISPEVIVREEMVFRSGDLEENAFFYGDGVRKPIGIFVAHADCIPAARDVSGSESTPDTYIDAKYSLREPYLRSNNLRWVFHRQAVKTLAKLKSTTNEPLWLVSTRDGQPETFLNVKVVLSEYGPQGTGAQNAWQSGDYLGIIGDFANYDVIDGLDMGITRHTDSYYDRKNQIGFVARRKVDGCARVGEAFARVKKS